MTSLTSSTTRALARLSISGASVTPRRGAAASVARAQPFSTTASTTARASSNRTRSNNVTSSPSRKVSPTAKAKKEVDPVALALAERERQDRITKKQVTHLHSIGWLEHQELKDALNDAAGPDGQPAPWVGQEWQSFCLFRAARARLWEPRFTPADAGDDAAPTDEYSQEWLADAIADHQARYPDGRDINARIDELLIPVWKVMDAQQREFALIEVRFTCLYKLGWRQGYTAGYPVTEEQADLAVRQELVDKTASSGAAAYDAMAELQENDRTLAWNAWIDMSAEEREREEAAAWAARDRTLLYIDDTPGKKLLESNVPRWYEKPQRAGNLVFLPNFTMRLVRNHTPPGEPYDAYKATFRVPLNLHKHSVRSFLLQVYGLRTTWIRSMVYRSPLKLNDRRQRVSDSSRTHKKIEVGLLEPFVFPAIVEQTKDEDLMVREYELMVQKQMYKSRNRGYVRWRGAVPLPDRKAASRLDPWQVDLLEPSAQQDAMQALEEEQLISGDDETVERIKKEREPYVLYKVPQKWTQSHGKILKLLNDKRNARMALVDEKAEQMRGDRANSDRSP